MNMNMYFVAKFVLILFTIDKVTSYDDSNCAPVSSYKDNVRVGELGYKIAVKQLQAVTDNIDDFIKQLRENVQRGQIPESLSIVYRLYTRANPRDYYVLEMTPESFKNSPFNGTNPIIVFFHGFIEVLDRRYMTSSLRLDLLNRANYNVIYIDYSDVTGQSFPDALKDTYSAIKPMTEFINFLLSMSGKRPEELHFISDSLGCHTAAMVAKLIPNVGRHTALDIGSPIFDQLPDDLIVTRNDALFVDVIHSADAQPWPKGVGIFKPSGHLDFYPNGGKFQPGCNSTQDPEIYPTDISEIRARVYMHVRAVDLYLKSICVRDCQFIGVLCDTYENYKKGICTRENSFTSIMGHDATKPTIDLPKDAKFFLDTSSDPPFCIK